MSTVFRSRGSEGDAGATRELRPAGPNRGFWALVGAALVLLGVGAIVLSTSFDSPVEAGALGRNVPVNEGAQNPTDLSSHNSPTLLRNPLDASNVVVANRIDSPRYSCALHVSFDGGGHWSQTPIPAPVGEEPKCYAPDVAFGPDGTLYLSYVTLKGRANAPHAVWIASSRDGGKTLSQPTKVLGKLAFQVRLAADPKTPRRLYMTYLQASQVGLYKFTQTGNPIEVVRSNDAGSTWTKPVQVSDSARQRVIAPSPAVGPNGQLYVLYLDIGGDALDYQGLHKGRGGPPYDGSWSLVLGRSSDQGATWQQSLIDDKIVPTERFIVFTPPFPSLAVDQHSGRLYAGFQDAREGDADVYVWSLPKGADDWKGPSRVNDTPKGDKTSQYLPALTVAPNGRLDVVYYDRRADRTNVLNEVSFQDSDDHGSSFSKRIRLSDRAFSSKIGFGSERKLPDLGSRLGLVSTRSRSMAVWTDTRAGTPTTGKQDLARGLVAFSDPARLSDPVKYLLRIGGIALVVLGVLLIAAAGLGLLPGRRPQPAG